MAELIRAAQAALKSGQYAQAARLAEQILQHGDEDTDGLYLAAVSARYLQQFERALACLARLKRASPEYGRAYQEEGHVYKALGQTEQAVRAYEMATRYNPALQASWRGQIDLLTELGRPEPARQAEIHLQRIQALPDALLAVTHHLHEGRVLRAEEIARAYLRKHPHHIEGMRLLAEIGVRLGVLDDADFLLETAIGLAPDTLQLRIDHIQVLRKRQKFAEARAQAQNLLARDPDSPVFQSLFAIESLQAGDYDTALEMFDKVLARLPGDSATLTSRGHALKTYGRTADAIVSYQEAAGADPANGDAWYALANLKTYRFSDAELSNMQEVEQRPDLSFMARVHIAFALGKALEDRGNYAGAFAAFQRGNDLKRQQTRYTTEQMEEEFDAQKRYATQAVLSTQAGKGCLAPDPIFIVGLPRAGSTLIEQILASHSQVDGTLELPNILALAHRLRGRHLISDRNRYPRILAELSGDTLQQLGQAYIETTRIHRQGAAYFTDKMPNNFRHIGLIHLILPNARIIDARRAPLDCCWSGYKQLFAEGQEFTYGLGEIGAYYRGYTDLMAHWDAVLPPDRILRVQHEDVLADLDGQVRRILDYCGLPFESGCVDFHTTQRAVRTASSEQVRQPLSRIGQNQWRPYEAFLDPLKSALGSALE